MESVIHSFGEARALDMQTWAPYTVDLCINRLWHAHTQHTQYTHTYMGLDG